MRVTMVRPPQDFKWVFKEPKDKGCSTCWLQLIAPPLDYSGLSDVPLISSFKLK